MSPTEQLDQITAEDMLIPGVEDVVRESTSHHRPEGSDPVSESTMILNMGPQHPSTHGVLRLVLEIDGETIVSLAPDIGYLHTGIEKTCEAKFYNQVTPMTDRIDYLCPMTNNTAYALAVEKLLELEVPERAQYIRVLFNELTRIQSHLVWLGTHAMDMGALTIFLYCFREREALLRIFEAVSGQRMMTSYVRIGGVALEMPSGMIKDIRAFLADFPSKIAEYEGLLNNNPIWKSRLQGVGKLTAEQAIALGVSGPPPASISTSAATCLTPAMRSSSSTSPSPTAATSGPATSSAWTRCARALRSACRPSTVCPKAASSPMPRRSSSRTASR